MHWYVNKSISFFFYFHGDIQIRYRENQNVSLPDISLNMSVLSLMSNIITYIVKLILRKYNFGIYLVLNKIQWDWIFFGSRLGFVFPFAKWFPRCSEGLGVTLAIYRTNRCLEVVLLSEMANEPVALTDGGRLGTPAGYSNQPTANHALTLRHTEYYESPLWNTQYSTKATSVLCS